MESKAIPQELNPPKAEELIQWLVWVTCSTKYRPASVQGDGIAAACQWVYGWGPQELHDTLDRMDAAGTIFSQWRDDRRTLRLPWMVPPKERKAATETAAAMLRMAAGEE